MLRRGEHKNEIQVRSDIVKAYVADEKERSWSACMNDVDSFFDSQQELLENTESRLALRNVFVWNLDTK